MANRYWVGGTATWDGTAGTKWAATSGGLSGASVPTSADDVFFDAFSTGTCTISGSRSAKSLNTTGHAGTLAGTATPILTLSGSLILRATQNFSGTTPQLVFNATANINLNGNTWNNSININGSGATVTLDSNLNISTSSLTITQGTFTTSANNYSITAGSLLSTNANIRSIILNGSTVNLSSTSNPIDFTNQSNLTFNAGTSTINLTGNITSFAPTFGSMTFYNVAFTNTTTAIRAISGGNFIFNRLTVTGPATIGNTQIQFAGRHTFNDGLATTGTAGNRRVRFRSNAVPIAHTITCNGAGNLIDADFADILVIGTAAPISGTRIGNLGGCKGITFSTPKTVYWNLAGAQNWSANGWSDTSTGTPNTDFFPLAQDTATFTNAGSVTDIITLDVAIPYISTVDMSGRTSAMTLNIASATTPNIYGDWKNGSGTTLTFGSVITSGLIFAGRKTQTITSAGKIFACLIEVNSPNGSVELADTLEMSTGVLTITQGTFNTKNFTMGVGAISSNNSNLRSIVLGTSTVFLFNTSPLTFTNGTNLTFNAGTSQINLQNANGSTITGSTQGNAITFYNLSFINTSVASNQITGNCTFNNLSAFNPGDQFVLQGISSLIIGANLTITGTFTIRVDQSQTSDSPIKRTLIRSDVSGTTRTLTVNTLATTDCDFQDITIAGAAAGSSPTRAGNCGGNSGITFPAAKTVYWNLAGTQSWHAIAWANTSGGTPNINNFPLAQDTAVFNNTGAVGTVSLTVGFNIGTLDASARTNAWTLDSSSVGVDVYGDFKLGSGATTVSTSTPITFRSRDTQTINCNGNFFNCAITIASVGGTVQLGDSFRVSSGRTFTLNSGTFDASIYNVTVPIFNTSFSNARTLKMGSGIWSITPDVSGISWNCTTTTNLTFLKQTANIEIYFAATTINITFAGGGLSYNKVTFTGPGSGVTYTFTGNNQFTEFASTKANAFTIALGTTTQTFGKWTVTGTVGNVVTLTGTGTSHVLAGACTSGINYLAMGSIGFAATSPGEFYAGANSTGTAAAPVYRTAKPADSTRYWVGGTGNWSSTTKWSTLSGGTSGASVPRSHDDVVFNSASSAAAYTATIDTVTGGIRCKNLTIAGPASGNVTLAGTAAMVGIHGNVTLPATGLTRTYTGAMTLSSNSTGRTFTTNGVTLANNITLNGVDCSWSLGSTLTNGTSNSITITNGSLSLATFNLTTGSLVSANQNTRTINFSTGTTTLTSAAGLNFGTTQTERETLTVTASTSQISLSDPDVTFTGNNKTFYNVSFTSTSSGATVINGTNSFTNLSFSGLTSQGLNQITLTGNQTITGTLTFSAGTDATYRRFIRSDAIGTTRTLTVAAFSGTDVDFRDIAVTGAAAPISGTRLGDVKGNSGITFPSPKTVYVRSTGSTNWNSSTGWSATSGGTADITQFPLAQDTAVFPAATYPASGSTITIDRAYNLGTIDMSLRTSNTVTLNMASSFTNLVCGSLINGTGTTISGSAPLTFAGRGNQTITSAGKTFTQSFTINSPGGTVTLQDSFVANQTSSSPLTITSGTFDAATFNVTLSDSISGLTSSNTNTRTIAIGSGTWTVAGTGGWNTSTSTNLTVTGTGIINLTSASAKTFAGGSASYSGITLNQGGNGTLTITGNNTFKTISSTAAGANTINIGNTTQKVTTLWTAAGTAGNVLTVQGTSATSPGTLIFTGSGTAANVDYLAITDVIAYNINTTWYAGTNSTNNGSLGWNFIADPDAPLPSTSTGNFFLLF